MSGTDHSAKIEQILQPRMVLVRPQMGENIGASARAMWNFSLDQMHLVAPRDGWPNPAAKAMASGAAQVLDQVVVHQELGQAVGDLHHVFATTARPRGMTKEVVSPKEAMKRTRALMASGGRVGFLFGAERAGLENEDIVLADAIVSVPVNAAYGSINLAQSVLILAYEWMLSGLDQDPSRMKWASSRPAKREERAHLQDALEARLESIGFFWPEDKAQSMRLSLRNMFARLPLSDADIRTFHGLFRALERGRNFPNKSDDAGLGSE